MNSRGSLASIISHYANVETEAFWQQTSSILTQMVGLSAASKIWQKLHVYHASQSTAKVKKDSAS